MTSFVKVSAFLILLLAVTIGTIGKLRPQLFFLIPNVGFIFWVATGHRMPPYFDPEPMEQPHFDAIVEDGDCILGSLPKSGTIWLHNIIHLLKNDGNDDFRDMLMDHVGMSEFLLYPESTIEERVQQVQTLREREAERPQRKDKSLTHFSHLSPADEVYGLDVSKHPKVKYVVTYRNPKEIIRSFETFLNSHTPEFRKQWGGFPPPIASPEACLDFVLSHQEFIFAPAIAWWNVRHGSNVLLVNYADLKKDPRGQIQRVANFLDIPPSEALLDVVVHKSSHQYMKDRETKSPGIYNMLHGRPDKPKFFSVNQHIGEGKSGGSEAFFTPSMLEKYQKNVGEMLGEYPDLAKWMVEGGEY